MSTLLEQIVEEKRVALGLRAEVLPLQKLEAEVVPSRRSFAAALAGPGVGLIAEIKQRSPSLGRLQQGGFSPRAIAALYDRYASAISVLTDAPFFGGKLEDLKEARRGSSLPLLLKDFVIEPRRQILEARWHGADAVLLIARLLSPAEIEGGLSLTRELGMAALVEVHTQDELERVLRETSASLIGVNSRDLATLKIDHSRLPPMMLRAREAGCQVVAESGLSTPLQLEALAGVAGGALIGSSLLRAADPAAAIEALGFRRRAPRIKVCGVRTRQIAELCSALSIDRVGINLVPSSRRKVSLEEARHLLAWIKGPEPVFVLRDPSAEELLAVDAVAGPRSALQLHGREPVELCARLAAGRPVIKALPVSAGFDRGAIERYRSAGAELLLDGAEPGSGQKFDWGSLGMARGDDCFVAGGLDAENVGALVLALDPRGVDVASGVEEGGVITPARVRDFRSAVLASVKGARS